MNHINAIKLRNFIGIQTVRLWNIRLKYQTLPNLKVWTPMLNLMALTYHIGTEKNNCKLSIRRAQALKKHLVKAGIRANITTIGKGEYEPVRPYDPSRYTRKQINQINRRVEFAVDSDVSYSGECPQSRYGGCILRNGALIISETFKPNLTGFKNLSGLVLGFIEFSFLNVMCYDSLRERNGGFRYRSTHPTLFRRMVGITKLTYPASSGRLLSSSPNLELV